MLLDETKRIDTMDENEYLVTWTIDMYANSHEEAAEKALNIQRNTESLATVFDVFDKRTMEKVEVDLIPE